MQWTMLFGSCRDKFLKLFAFKRRDVLIQSRGGNDLQPRIQLRLPVSTGIQSKIGFKIGLIEFLAQGREFRGAEAGWQFWLCCCCAFAECDQQRCAGDVSKRVAQRSVVPVDDVDLIVSADEYVAQMKITMAEARCDRSLALNRLQSGCALVLSNSFCMLDRVAQSI